VEAVQVPLENTFHKILEKMLNESMPFTVEVIALGGSGRGARRNYEILKNIGIKFSPDLVILEFLSNDPIDDSPVLTKELIAQQKLRDKYIPKLSEIYYRLLFLRNSRFNQLLALKIAKVYQNLKIVKYASLDKYGFIPFNAMHLNKAGHKVVAQAIYNYLLQHNLIKERSNEDF
jgi:lysophospholipase L1-like esterase